VRKAVYTQEDIVKAGLELVRRGGLRALSARRVAEVLGASTAPVYSNFATMEELANAIKRAAVQELLTLTHQPHADDGFLNMGVGILKFVWDWPELYAALFLEPAREYDPGVDLMGILVVAAVPAVPLIPGILARNSMRTARSVTFLARASSADTVSTTMHSSCARGA